MHCKKFSSFVKCSFFHPVFSKSGINTSVVVFQTCWKLSSLFSTSAPKHQDSKIKVLSRPRPIVTFNNWMYGNLLRGYFNQDFFLDEFCRSCPYVVEQIVKCLTTNNTDDLKDAVDAECLKEIISRWNQCSPDQKKFYEESDHNTFQTHYPTIRMRMPGQLDPTKEIPAFVNIKIDILFFAKNKDISSEFPFGELITNRGLKYPFLNTFIFEKEVTKGVDDSWLLKSCGRFPSFEM